MAADKGLLQGYPHRDRLAARLPCQYASAQGCAAGAGILARKASSQAGHNSACLEVIAPGKWMEVQSLPNKQS